MKLRKAEALLLSLTITCSLAACGGASMLPGSMEWSGKEVMQGHSSFHRGYRVEMAV